MIFETEVSLQFDILQFWITLDKNNGTVCVSGVTPLMFVAVKHVPNKTFGKNLHTFST
jgi:hypothetical protein